jgi:hypothetical protein
MNGFLARLATRTLAPESAIRPRLPGVFEPSVDLAPEGMTISTRNEDTPRESIASDAILLRPPSPAAHVNSPPREFPSAELILATNEPRMQPPLAQKISAPSRTMPSAEPARAREEHRPTRPTTASPRLPIAPDAERPRRAASIPVRIAVARENKAQPEQEEHAERTIKVTIGRIDVRAIHAPEPQRTPPSAPAEPHLPLDKYLLQRRQGRR